MVMLCSVQVTFNTELPIPLKIIIIQLTIVLKDLSFFFSAGTVVAAN